MYQAIVFLPLAGFLIAGLFGRFIGPRPSELVTTSLLFVAAALAWVTFAGFLTGQSPVVDRASDELVQLGHAACRLGPARRYA